MNQHPFTVTGEEQEQAEVIQQDLNTIEIRELNAKIDKLNQIMYDQTRYIYQVHKLLDSISGKLVFIILILLLPYIVTLAAFFISAIIGVNILEAFL